MGETKMRAFFGIGIRQAAFVIGVATFGAALGTVVSAHGGDTTRIHACVKNSGGTVRIVGASEACKSGETAVDWNITGVGVPGPVGPKGDKGPKGDQGLR